MTFKNIFNALFLLHLVSGVANRHLKIEIAGFSIIGLLNLMAIEFFIITLGISKFSCHFSQYRHVYIWILSVYLLCSTPSLFFNPDIRGLISFATTFASLASIYYLGQLYWKQLPNPEKTIVRILKIFFVFTVTVGLLHALYVGFSFDKARENMNKFSFIFFEYPHSAGIVISSLLPLYYCQIIAGKISKKHLANIYIGLPIALLFSGSRIAFLTYVVSLGATLVYTHSQNIKGAILSLLLLLLGIAAIVHSPFYGSIVEIFETPFDTYLAQTDTYSINSTHTRIKVWRYMAMETITNNRLYFGAGWRAWTTKYINDEDFVSAQSDYFTIFFDAGIIGLFGFLLYRILGAMAMLRDGLRGSKESFYLTIGAVAGLFIGSFSETVEGYASTSWLFPIFLSLSHYYNKSRRFPTFQ